MGGKRHYPEGVKAALHVMSGGGCYRQECGEPAIRLVDGVPEINLQIAHIHALEPGGPREIKGMSTAERNCFSNLIWLCGPCHKRVDADEVAYPASLLKKWKRDREAKPLGSLAGLRDLDVAALEELLRRAMTEIREDMAAFNETFPDLARLLAETIERLPSLDPESLHLLSSAAIRLDLPEYAPVMHSAAVRLELPDFAPAVDRAARSMELPEYAPQLVTAANELNLPSHVPRLEAAIRSLNDAARDFDGLAATMSDTADRVEAAASAVHVAETSIARQVGPATSGCRLRRQRQPCRVGPLSSC